MRTRALIIATLLTAYASPAVADPDRILFRYGIDTPASEGPHAAANAAALSRLGGLLSSWPSTSPWSLMFVADRNATCQGAAAPCVPPMMLWRRQGAATAMALSSRRAAVPTQRPPTREAFTDELPQNPVLSTAPTGHASVHVRLFHAPPARPSTSCPIDILVEDRDLPPLLPGSTSNAIHGQHIPLGLKARLTARLGASPVEAVAIYWELADGAFCRAAANAPRIDGVPQHARAAHFIFGRPPLAGKLPASPIADCNGNIRRALADYTTGTRGMHDHGRDVPQGTVQPAGVTCLLTIAVTLLAP